MAKSNFMVDVDFVVGFFVVFFHHSIPIIAYLKKQNKCKLVLPIES